MTWRVIDGDCVERMRELPEASVDAIVCDPPYHLGFMGKAWDTITPGESQHEHERWAREALRVLKPGGHLLAFGGTRTYHRLACGIEDAGFEIRDRIDGWNGQRIECSDGSLAWYYGSGFPKSLDVSKAIDRAAGAEREVVGSRDTYTGHDKDANTFMASPRLMDITAPATPEAEQWQGWGTALKPAHEPIIVARKPLTGTVAGNVLAHGTGALNIDGCRIGETVETWPASRSFAAGISPGYTDGIERGATQATGDVPAGRWPANVILDEHAAQLLDEQTGELHSGANPTRRGSDKFRTAYGDFEGQRECEPARGADSGGASRFFYCAKAATAERNAGLGQEGAGSLFAPVDVPDRNAHPTVKPIELMRWLVRLVTPPGGTILDPFTGSGTTGCAAVLEGFDFIGIERETEYASIARARITHWSAGVLEDMAA